MNDKKKVILINGDTSKWYEQVIFIVKEEKEDKVPKNLVLEAEKIINEYVSKKYNKIEENKIDKNVNSQKSICKNNKNNKRSKKNTKIYNNILNVSIFCTVMIICYLLYQIYI